MKLPLTVKELIISCVLLIFMLVSAGCATNGSNMAAGTDEALEQLEADAESIGDLIDEAPDEIVELPELPVDDGIPLDAAERIALHSTGYLDAKLSEEDKALVERHFKYYLHSQRKAFDRYLGRASDYLPYVRQVFREKGVPEELAYLAIVESGFNSRAVSRAGATGMWQFMRSTGKLYGLTQNTWIDERRDPYKSTAAAADYLLKLYEIFGDWQLAVASYNAGEGKILRAIKQTGATGFFDLCRKNNNIPQRKARLKLETQQYVPRLIAVTKIMRNLEILGLTPPDEASALEVTAIKVGPGTDLGSLAKKSGLKWEEFTAINPAYRRTISPPSLSTTAYLPVDNAQLANTWLAKAEAQRFAGWQQYRVRRGDSLYSISSRHRISVDVLRQANNMHGNLLREGAVLIVPGSRPSHTAQAKSNPVKSAVAKSKPILEPGATLYTVKSGDSLYSIATAHGITVRHLQKANGMGSRQTRLMPGQQLGIPAQPSAGSTPMKTASTQSSSGGGESTIVRKGDTLYGIALQHNTSVDELLRLNGLSKRKPLQPGQEILLP